ncbi:type II toxin-antitoxin system RelE/ParE family toxin [Myxococcota bacterium]
MTTLRWTLRAQRDLLEIGNPLAQEDPELARRWVERLRKRARVALTDPYGGRRVPELGREDVREVFPSRTYRIVYRATDNEIHILTIFRRHRLSTRDEASDQDT